MFKEVHDFDDWKVGEKRIVKVDKDWRLNVKLPYDAVNVILNMVEFKGLAWGDDVNDRLYEFERKKDGFESTLRKFKVRSCLYEI